MSNPALNNYWTFSMDGEVYVDEFESSKICLATMDEHYAEKVQEDEDLKNGDVRCCDAEIIRFRYGNDNEREVIFSQEVIAEYEHYHGDLREHGTY